MGYKITIGNAVPVHSKENNYLYASWEVEVVAHDNAPVFPNDDLTGNTNSRYPSYIAWADSMRALGLYDLFYNMYEGLLEPHPGCKILTPRIVKEIDEAVNKYRATATKPAGSPGQSIFDQQKQKWFTPDENTYDAVLMRGEWLLYWATWAVNNCETPAIQNS